MDALLYDAQNMRKGLHTWCSSHASNAMLFGFQVFENQSIVPFLDEKCHFFVENLHFSQLFWA